ncbi:MAG TPA: succinate dehydrogenase, cytochrome b556 subunit [Usitatibacter sp.]|jgi:succinate dehydrogenase / fumarate reductase cytochrome b subunit|nr:succinate dehydrogenase, cytochrome b556 subunit [Usitatibacter sp.]
MSAGTPPRPKHYRPWYDLNLAHLPPPGLLSIFHRVSGAALFFPILPLALYALQSSLGSEAGFARWHDLAAHPLAKLLLTGAAWLYAHHFFAGLRYLALDLHWGIAKAPARASAIVVLVLGVASALLFAWRIW